MLEKYFIARKKLYPQKIFGKFRSIKNKLNFIFLAIYCLSPFLRYDRGEFAPNQAILIDIVNSKAYFFFIEIWAQEVFYLAGILILLAVALFFVTSLFGRVWCGYGCPQTVWTDVFIMVERFFQGDRNDRILLDRKNNFNKYFRKFLTHLLWIIIGFFTGLVFVNYFNDSLNLSAKIFTLNFSEISLKIWGWILGIGFMTYIMAGFAREHVCTYMCPYARFQSAMFDDNTLIVSYDQKRGEPRAKHHAGEPFENRGHCIDCKQCVVVCPTGIDIRGGLQMECIACGLCIDACDNIMQKVGLPKGLIRYDTLANLNNPTPQNKFKILQARTFYYATILILVASLMLYSLITKPIVETSIYQERNPLFVTLSDGSIRNIYNLKIINKDHRAKHFRLRVINPDFADIKISNYDSNDIKVQAVSAQDFRILLSVSAPDLAKFSDDMANVNLELMDLESKGVQKISTIFIWK